jgi:small GTP-binding protein
LDKQIIKVIFIGLDDSGKTSILNTLEGKFAQNIRPTIRFERTDFNILGLPIKIWDVGGQEQYRKDIKIRDFLEGTDLLFYVIDIQNQERFAESVEYFLDIITIFEKIQKLPHIMILLHKTDPEIQNAPKIRETIQIVTSLYAKWAKYVDLGFYETSIYDPSYLSQVFVKGILKILPKGEVIQEVLASFMETTESNAIILYDQQILPIAEAWRNKNSFSIIEICGPYFASMIYKIDRYGLMPPDTVVVQMDGWIFFRYIILEETKLYLIFFTRFQENFSKINKILPEFTKDLLNVVKYVL